MSLEPPSGSQDRLSEMPTRAELYYQWCCNSNWRNLSEVCLVVLKDISEEITEMESDN